jgi:hypothetical protein
MSYNKREIIWIALMSVLLLLICFCFLGDPMIKRFITDNKTALYVFLGILAVVSLITAKIFSSTKFDDEYTPATVKTSIINIIIWSAFWLCWCCYNLLVLFEYPLMLKLLVFSFLVTSLPVILVFCITYSVWKEEQKDLAERKNELITSDYAAVEKAYRFSYYSGHYGILTIPLYIIVAALYYGIITR